MTFIPAEDRRVSPWLAGITALEVVVLVIAGGGLLLGVDAVRAIWPWPLAPFHARYLGAVYTAALIAAAWQAGHPRWSPARLVTTMIFTFTLAVTIGSCLHLDRFAASDPSAWIWFVLYVGVCANAFAHLWAYRTWPRPGAPGLRTERPVLAAQCLLLGGYGLAMLVFGSTLGVGWPWPVDTFHAQVYSAAYLTPAAGAWVLRESASRSDWRTMGWTQTAWGALPILGVAWVDLTARRLDWQRPATLAWFAGHALIAALGLWMLARARHRGLED